MVSLSQAESWLVSYRWVGMQEIQKGGLAISGGHCCDQPSADKLLRMEAVMRYSESKPWIVLTSLPSREDIKQRHCIS
eukprot:3315616-Amphidinium_carterae.1